MLFNRKQVAQGTGALAAAVAVAVAALVGFEGNPGRPYYDQAMVLTDCYGDTKSVRKGVNRSEAECQALLGGDAKRIGTFIIRDVPDIPVPVLAAAISFTYNVGDGAYRSSTFRKKLMAGNYLDACTELFRWVYHTETRNGKRVKVINKGLKNRRDKEFLLCTSTS